MMPTSPDSRNQIPKASSTHSPLLPSSLFLALRQHALSRLDLWIRLMRWTSLLACPCLIVMSLLTTLSTRQFIKTCVSTQGKIIRFMPKDQGEDGLTFAPVVAFDAPNGKHFEVTSTTRTSSPEFSVGQSVTVLYQSSDPAYACISSFWQLWTVPITCGALGLFFGVLGYVLLRIERWRDRRGEFRLAQAPSNPNNLRADLL